MEFINTLKALQIPFSGIAVKYKKKEYHISPFPQISISGIGPIFYYNKKEQRIYTLLQRRFKDNFQWWFPGGYVELPAKNRFFNKNFNKIKKATIDEFYQQSLDCKDWQKARKKINDPKELAKLFKKHKINWPKKFDANWQEAWKREVLEESGINIDKFLQTIILNLKISETLMLGAESDRLVNIDGKFCAFLGELNKEPKSKPDNEIEESKWIAINDINFSEKEKKYISHKNIVNPYVISLIEEALFEIICYKIKEISKIKNPITKQQISRFNTPQNLQSFLLNNHLDLQNKDVKEFLSWEFGDLEIGKNLCGKKGDKLYNTTIKLCKKYQND
jgi:hypothetical protein